MAGIVAKDAVEYRRGCLRCRHRRCEALQDREPELAVRVVDVADEHLVADG